MAVINLKGVQAAGLERSIFGIGAVSPGKVYAVELTKAKRLVKVGYCEPATDEDAKALAPASKAKAKEEV